MNNTRQKYSLRIGLLASMAALFLALGLAGQALAQTATITQRISPGETGGASQGSFIDAAGNLWYDQSSGSCVISRFVPSTGAITSWTVLEFADAGGDPGNTTGGVVVDASTGQVYFTYIETFGIRRLNPTTAVVRSWITGFINPNGVTLDATGRPFYAASSANRIARLDPSTNVRTIWQMPTPNSFPFDIVRDPATGAFYFTETSGNRIGRLNPTTNVITEWTVPTVGGGPRRLSLDAAGDVWFTEISGNKIGRLNPGTNVITEFAVPTANSRPTGMVGRVSGSAFSELSAKNLGRMLPSGGVSTTVTPTSTTVTPSTSTLGFFDTQQRVLNFNPTPQIDVVPGVLTPTFVEFAIPNMPGVNNFQGAPDLEATANPNVFAFSTTTGPAKVGTVEMFPPRPLPEVDIVTITQDGGPCLEVEATISDPLNEPLSGVVRVLETVGPATIDALTFTALNTSCGFSPDVFEFFLNGVSLGTFSADPNFTCSCAAPEISYTITNAALLANWQQGVNTFRFTKSGTNQTLIAWVKVDIQFPSGSATACIFDFNGGNCNVANLCSAGFTSNPVDVTQTVNITTEVELISEAYTNSTLPCSFDISSLTVGNSYILEITANVDNVSGNDRQSFVYNGEDVISINECGCFISIDIKPQSCPNPLNTGKNGVLPVAVLGGDDFDINDIDRATVQLEGVASEGRNLSPEDVATPFGGELCDCDTLAGDGFTDQVFMFDAQAIVAALGAVTNREERELTLTGNLLDGTPFSGKDCVRIIVRGKPGAVPVTIENVAEKTETSVLPEVFSLNQNYPNPFNPSTKISLSLPEAANWEITIYNIQGQKVSAYSGFSDPGVVTIEWDGSDYASGMYFYKATAGEFSATRKMVLLK